MLTDIHWIGSKGTPKLAIMARPRAGDWLEDEIVHWKRSGVEFVVSLLESEEVTDLGLEREQSVCEQYGIEFVSFPIPDRGTPDAKLAVDFIINVMRRNLVTAIHCRAGIGRSSIMAAAILIHGGAEPAEALSLVQEARGTQVPDTESQRDWVLHLKDVMRDQA